MCFIILKNLSVSKADLLWFLAQSTICTGSEGLSEQVQVVIKSEWFFINPVWVLMNYVIMVIKKYNTLDVPKLRNTVYNVRSYEWNAVIMSFISERFVSFSSMESVKTTKWILLFCCFVIAHLHDKISMMIWQSSFCPICCSWFFIFIKYLLSQNS